MNRWPNLRTGAALVGAMTVGGCAGAPRSAAPTPSVANPFAASSISSSYGIQGRFDGTWTRTGDWINITVTGGAMRGFQGDAVHYSDLQLRAAVSACTGARAHQVVSESRAVKLGPVFGIGTRLAGPDTATRTMHDTLRLAVAVPPGTSPDRSWLSLELEWPFENTLAAYVIETDAALAGGSARRPAC